MGQETLLVPLHRRMLELRRQGYTFEEIAADTGRNERSVRRILNFCGLPFDPACLAFHRTARSVRTASSEQVRQPIFRENLEQWKNYEPWLTPLRAGLGEALARYRE